LFARFALWKAQGEAFHIFKHTDSFHLILYLISRIAG
jgi:hypothetical protein